MSSFNFYSDEQGRWTRWSPQVPGPTIPCESVSLEFVSAGHACIRRKSAYILDNLFLYCFRFLITAPNVIHLGTQETVTVQVHGAERPVQVAAYFTDETKNQLLSDKIIFNLNQNNNYQEMKKVMVSLPSYRCKCFNPVLKIT